MEDEADIYADLPEDPEQAFIELEGFFRRRCENQIQSAHENENVSSFYVEYISRVLAAIQELGLSTAFERDVPSINDVGYATYVDFGKDVDHYITTLRIRHGRRTKGYSVRLDQAAKQRINHHIGQLREMFGSLELPVKKRDGLLKKLNALQLEVDRERTRLEVLGDLVVETAGVVGQAGEKLESWRRIIDSIAGVFWGQRQEEQKRLPAPPERKRIEPPRERKLPAERDELDDEIPF